MNLADTDTEGLVKKKAIEMCKYGEWGTQRCDISGGKRESYSDRKRMESGWEGGGKK